MKINITENTGQIMTRVRLIRFLPIQGCPNVAIFSLTWEYIKQEKINKNNERENLKRLLYEYQVGDNILLRKGTEYKPLAGR